MEQLKSRKGIVIAIFIAVIAVLLICAVAFGGNTEKKWQEQYDLGMRYLQEENYEEAIVAFQKAIQLDPNQASSYLGLAEIYIQQKDYDNALAILQDGYDKTSDSEVQKKLDEVKTMLHTLSALKPSRIDYLNGEGQLLHYQEFTYNQSGNEATVTSYDAEENQTGYVECQYDADGNETVSWSYSADYGDVFPVKNAYKDGKLIASISKYTEPDGTESEDSSYYTYDTDGLRINSVYKGDSYSYEWVYEYDENQNCIKETEYSQDGNPIWYLTHEYNENQQKTKTETYNETGDQISVTTYQYDSDGNQLGYVEERNYGMGQLEVSYQLAPLSELLNENAESELKSVAADSDIYDMMNAWLRDGATQNDIVGQGYSLEDVGPLYRSADEEIYKISGTDIELILTIYDPAADEPQGNSYQDNRKLYYATAPAKDVLPQYIGKIRTAFVENDIAYFVGYPVSGDGGFIQVFDGFSEVIDDTTEVTIVSRNLVNTENWSLILENIAKLQLRNELLGNIAMREMMPIQTEAETDSSYLFSVWPYSGDTVFMYSVDKTTGESTFIAEIPVQKGSYSWNSTAPWREYPEYFGAFL